MELTAEWIDGMDKRACFSVLSYLVLSDLIELAPLSS